MELENHTAFPALLFRTSRPEKDGVPQFAAAVISRVTYDITEWGVVPASEQAWALSPGPWDGPQGPMDGDEVFRREGVDLFVFGHARAPGGKPVKRMTVELRTAGVNYSTVVFGDRVWKKAAAGLVPSEPEAFKAIPLTLERSFGGSYEWDGLQIPHPENEVGRGFVQEEEDAVGRPLPNVELPGHLVQKWNDLPPIARWRPLPMMGRERLARGVEYGEDGRLLGLKPLFFNAAPTGLIAPKLEPGQKIEINGVRERGPLTIELPPNNLKVRLRFGDKVHEQPLAIDQVGIEPDEQRMFVTFRYPFRYGMRENTKRTLELLPR